MKGSGIEFNMAERYMNERANRGLNSTVIIMFSCQSYIIVYEINEPMR
jgi:hypothetical protein